MGCDNIRRYLIDMKDFETITEEEVEQWCIGTISDHTISWLTQILKGEYSLEDARKDILSFRNKSEQ